MANKKLKNFEYANQTIKGQLPSINTDKLSYFECINGSVFLIADGTTSDELGNRSAQLAIERIYYYLENEFVDNPMEAVYNCLIYANGFLYEQNRKLSDGGNMGVSVSCLLIRNNQLYYSTIGNAKIYFFNGKKAFLMAHGNASETDHAGQEVSGELLLGQVQFIKPEVNSQALIPLNGDMVVMMSDGLYKGVNEKGINKILSDPMPAQTKVYRLIDMANINDGSDNISAQIIAFYNLDHKIRQFVPIKEKTSPIQQVSKEKTSFDFSEILSKPVYQVIIAIVALLFLAYMVYDLFFYDPRPPQRKINASSITTTISEDADSEFFGHEVIDAGPVANRLPDDVVFVVQPGNTWSRIYSEFGVCSWFIKNHPSNAGKFDSDENPVAGSRIFIPVSFSAKKALNPNFYSEFTLEKTGTRCENVDERFLKEFLEKIQ